MIPITKDTQPGLWVLGAVVERKTARFQDAVYPLRDGKIEGTAAELSEVLTTLQRRQMLEPVYVVDRIHDSRSRNGETIDAVQGVMEGLCKDTHNMGASSTSAGIWSKADGGGVHGSTGAKGRS